MAFHEVHDGYSTVLRSHSKSLFDTSASMHELSVYFLTLAKFEYVSSAALIQGNIRAGQPVVSSCSAIQNCEGL